MHANISRVDAPVQERIHSVRLLLPDVIVLIVSAVTFGVLRCLYREESEPHTRQSMQLSTGKLGVIKKFVETFGELTIFILMGRMRNAIITYSMHRNIRLLFIRV